MRALVVAHRLREPAEAGARGDAAVDGGRRDLRRRRRHRRWTPVVEGVGAAQAERPKRLVPRNAAALHLEVAVAAAAVAAECVVGLRLAGPARCLGRVARRARPDRARVQAVCVCACVCVRVCVQAVFAREGSAVGSG